jgi:hypothetical protein
MKRYSARYDCFLHLPVEMPIGFTRQSPSRQTLLRILYGTLAMTVSAWSILPLSI